MLSHPDYRRPFVINTDTSDAGLGAVLSRILGGQERVVQYISRTFSHLVSTGKGILSNSLRL